MDNLHFSSQKKIGKKNIGSKIETHMARDAASLRPPPGTVNGKVVVLAFFCATSYFAYAFTTDNNNNNNNKRGDLKNDGKRRGNGDEGKKAKWYLPSNR